MLNSRFQFMQESLQKLLRRGDRVRVERMLKRTRPVDVALLMRFLNDLEQQQVFALLPDDAFRAETIAELDEHLISEVLEARPMAEVLSVLRLLGTDDQADVLALLPSEFRARLIDELKPDEAEEVEELLHYDPESAGGIMSPEFFALPAATTATDAIQALQQSEDVEMAFYIYVVNEPGHLVGVVSLRALVTHPSDTPLSEMMVSDVISATVETDQEEVARLAARYNLLAIPVVDEGNHLEGIVTIDDVIDVMREEATEDMLKMAGADETAYESYSLFRNFKTRAPWLLATWFGGLGASVLIGVFEAQIQSAIALAAFIPIVLGMGGNVGTQTATIIVRGLATGHVSEGVALRYLARETGIGLMLGCAYGILLGTYTIVMYGDLSYAFGLAITVALSILASMTSSASIGALTPLLFNRMRIDPAVATGPIVTTSVDVVGILVYFLVATAFLGAGN